MKTRFAPSPSGHMHLGNARTALFNALFAHSQKGQFLLRIEDTDEARRSPAYVQALKEDLHQLGLVWVEGPDVEGPHAPYQQSLRTDIYQKYYEMLEKQGLVYPCFCTPEELALSRKLQMARREPPRYAGTCRHLSAEKVAEKRAQGEKPAWRFQVPLGRTILFDDLLRGTQTFKSDDIGDFIIRRADGTSSFLFCSPLDDSLMGITHVLRGEDHLTNTPRQLLILEALGLPAPQYGHMALILAAGGDGGNPLSKREGSLSVRDLLNKGFLPLALLNYLARLGHHYTQNQWLSFEELAQAFELSHCSRSPAHFDDTQLLHWQKETLLKMSGEELVKWLSAELSLVPSEQQLAFVLAIRSNIVLPHDAHIWVKCVYDSDVSYTAEVESILQATPKKFFSDLNAAISSIGIDYAQLTAALQQAGWKGKSLFQPLRGVLTGLLHGPELAALLPLLGKEKALQRIARWV